jgi:hypothetical protein
MYDARAPNLPRLRILTHQSPVVLFNCALARHMNIAGRPGEEVSKEPFFWLESFLAAEISVNMEHVELLKHVLPCEASFPSEHHTSATAIPRHTHARFKNKRQPLLCICRIGKIAEVHVNIPQSVVEACNTLCRK